MLNMEDMWEPQFVDKTQMMEAMEVDQLLRTLQQSLDHDEVRSALMRIQDLFPMSPCQFEQNNTPQAVLKAMECLRNHVDIQQIGLNLLSTFISMSEPLFENVQESQIIEILMRILHDNASNVTVQFNGLKLLTKLLGSVTVQIHLPLTIKRNLMEILITNIKTYKENCDMLVYITVSLSVLLKEKTLQDDFVGKNLDLYLDLLCDHTEDMTLMIKAFNLLHKLASTASLRQKLVTARVLPLVYICLRVWKNELSVLVPCFELLADLCQEDAVVRELVEKKIIKDTLCPEMVARSDSPDLQLHGLTIFILAAEKLFKTNGLKSSASEVDTELGTQWLKGIYLAISRQMGRQDVQEVACKALTRLLRCQPNLYVWIGDNTDSSKQDPLHTQCLGAVLMSENNADLFSAAAEAIFYLSADNEVLCKSLMEKNTHVVIVRGLRQHIHNSKAVCAACKAIRGLCIFNDEHKKILVRDESDVLQLLTKVLTLHQGMWSVQYEAISTIACLADLDVVCHQCFVLRIQHLILSAMDAFQDEEVLQESCIEALSVLGGGAARGGELLHALNAEKKVLTCLKRFPKNINIQQKGLVALQMLIDPLLLQSPSICTTITSIIKLAIHNFHLNVSVEKEAVVTMQILAERGLRGEQNSKCSLMSETLVEQQCHKLLFKILERHDDDQDLHDLASECLYVIGIEHDLRSRMLVAACSERYVDGAECLIEIGADVNTGHGEETPLYYAVKNRDTNMVKLLLRQKLRDVQEELKLSLKQESHNITGLLLSHIGRDRENGILSWSSYDLCDLRPEWIMPSLTSTELGYTSSNTSRHFVSTIRRSEQRRIKRLRHSNSDTNLVIYRRRRFHLQSNSNRHVLSHLLENGNGMTARRRAVTKFDTYPFKRAQGARHPLIFASRNDENDLTASYEAAREWVQMHGNSIQEEETLTFYYSMDDLENWRRSTLTGANIPFSPDDPRQCPNDSSPSHGSPTSTHPRGHCLRIYSLPAVVQPSDLPLQVLDFEQSSSSVTRSTSPDYSSDTESGLSTQFFSEDTDREFLNAQNDNTSTLTLENFNVTAIDVSSNRIASLDNLMRGDIDFLRSLSAVSNLDLGNNLLKVLPTSFFQMLPGLSKLNLSGNQLSAFPFKRLIGSQIHVLDLSNNKISTLDLEGISECLVLEELILSENEVIAFPVDIHKAMPLLIKLNLASNQIQVIPDAPLELPELRFLDLSHNQITAFSEALLKSCGKLESLCAANNQLVLLPSENVATSLTKLAILRLSNNKIVEKEPFFIPKFILELPNLRVLDLAGNALEGFPAPCLWKTQILKELIVSRNNISKLNLENARLWSKLEKLHASLNKISELPKEIGELRSLQSLDVSYNKQLSTLPDELGMCTRLWEFPFDGLSLNLNFNFKKCRVQELRIYLHNRLKKAQCYYRMKMMVVGYGGRGKTSLLQALKKKSKHASLESPPVTVGVIVDEWKFDRSRSGKTVTYTLSTWDFAGQEDFYSTHQCFLSNRTLYLVVYDISLGVEEVDKLKPWLANIHARAPGCPVVIVGTHVDLVLAEDREQRLKMFESKMTDLLTKPGFPQIACSAVVDLTKDMSSELEQLRRRLFEIIDDYKVRNQPVMGQLVPASYVRLGEVLSEEARRVEKKLPVLRHRELMKIVKNGNLGLEDDELRQAVSFLHESGVLLHYDETTLQMRDFYFINPGWLCRMMAQVVTVPEINPFISRDGIMKRSSAEMLFTGKNVPGHSDFIFPPDLIPQYLHLLEKFEIALPRNEDELLIPCRLPSARPHLDLPGLSSAERVFRYYLMPFVPIGFWSRLLTRLIMFAESKFIEHLLMLGTSQAEVQYWQEGIFVKWNVHAFFLVDGCRGDTEEVHVTVPATPQGARLLGYLVDHIDALVDEWYPGLTCIDPLLGRELLQKFVPCTSCSGFESEPHLFEFNDLVKVSEENDTIYCPQHKASVSLAQLAPDVMFTDIEASFHLDLDKFDFKDSPDYLLGGGGFGSVYKAHYNGQTVATKVFTAIGDVHPHKMLRQEAIILRGLKHPSVVSLVAVAQRPQYLLVMEFAPCKSLASILHSNSMLSRVLQHKIILQVAEGLYYLHRLMIVYRDMKPDNVLIFSLAPDALINAKITDYGISQFTTLSPLSANQGTPSYRAPEVIRGESYSFQADMFSFGILMYAILTGGQHPFEELDSQSERDKAFADNSLFPPITQRGSAPWPDVQELINRCMHQVPDYRPRSGDLCRQLNSAELFCLKEVRPVSVGTTVECIAFQQEFSSGESVQLWVASGDNDYMQLTRLSLLDYDVQPTGMGTMFRDGRILCILQVSKQHVLLGTQSGKIWVFNAEQSELVHASKQLQDSVLCLHLISSRRDESLVLAGLANGKIALYPVSEIIQEPNTNPIELKLGESYEPLRCILRNNSEKRLFASCGTKIIVMDTRRGVAVDRIIQTVDNCGPASQPIIAMACGRHVYLSRRNMTVVQAWDTVHDQEKAVLDISEQFRLDRKDSRVTAMVLHDLRTLWVGTGGGHIALIDVVAWTPLTVTHRHTASVRCLLSVRLSNSGQYGAGSTNVILSGGLGFRGRPDCEIDRENQYGCIAVWEADYPQVMTSLKDQSAKRQQLLDR